MKTTAALTLLCFSLGACCAQQNSPPVDQHTQTAPDKVYAEKLAWVYTANPVQDARKAIDAGEKTLWGFDHRGVKSLPGVPPNKVDVLLKEYQFKRPAGQTDAIRGEEHRKALNAYRKYAEQFNQTMLQDR